MATETLDGGSNRSSNGGDGSNRGLLDNDRAEGGACLDRDQGGGSGDGVSIPIGLVRKRGEAVPGAARLPVEHIRRSEANAVLHSLGRANLARFFGANPSVIGGTVDLAIDGMPLKLVNRRR